MRIAVLCIIFTAGACSTSQPAPGDETDAATPTSIAADLGKSCNAGCDAKNATCLVRGYPSCSTGDCVLDARGGLTKLDSYCTSDCSGVACPSGYACEAVPEALTGAPVQRCVKDGSQVGPTDAGTDAQTKVAALAACTQTRSGCGSVCADLGKTCSTRCTEIGGDMGRVYGSQTSCSKKGAAAETISQCKQTRSNVADWVLCCCE